MQHYTQIDLVQCDQAYREPFLLLSFYSIASSIGLISALLDSGASHNFISSELVHDLQEKGTPLRI